MRKGQRGRHEARKARSHRSGTLGRGGRVALSVLACALAISGAGAIGYSMLTHRTTVSGGTQYADVFKKGQAYDSVDAQQFIANPTVTDEDREVIASLSGLMQQIYARETGDATAAKAWAEQTLPQLASWNDLQLPWSNSDVDPKTYVRLAELSRMELKSKAQSLGLRSDLQWKVIDFAYPAYEGDTGAVLGNAGQAQTTTRAAAILGNTGEPTVLEVITACDQKIRKDGVLHDGDEVNFRMDTYCIDISDENPTQEVHNIGELKSFGFELVSGPTFDAKEAQGSQISGAVGNSSGNSSGNSFHEVPDGTQRINQDSNQQTNQNDQGQGRSDTTGNQSQQLASNVMENPTQSGNNVNGTNEMDMLVADSDITDEDAQALAGVTVTIGGKTVDSFNPRKINAVADVTDLPELVTALKEHLVIPQEYVPVFHNLPDGWEVSSKAFKEESCQVVLSNHYNNKSYQYVINYLYVEKSNTSSSNGQNGASVSAPSNMASSYVTTRLMANTNLGPIVRDVRYYRWAQNANYEIKELHAYDALYAALSALIRVPQTSDNTESVQIPFYLGYYGEPGSDSPTAFNAIVIDGIKYDQTVPINANLLVSIANQIPAIANEDINKIAYVIVRSAKTSDDYTVPLHVSPLNGTLPNIPIDASSSPSLDVDCWEASKMSFVDGFHYAGNLGANGTYADDVLLVVAKNENGFQIVFDRDADAQKKAEEEAVAKKKAEEEAAANKKAEEEAAAKKKAEEEAAAKLAALKSTLRQGPVTVVSSVTVSGDSMLSQAGYDPTKDGVPTSGTTYQCTLDGAGNPTQCSIVQNRGRAGGPSSDTLTIDGDGFFTQVNSAASGTANWKLEKDGAGRLVKMSGTVGGVAVTYEYEYDGAGTRLAKMTHTSGSDKDVTTFNADGSRNTVTRHVGQQNEFVEKYTHTKNSQGQIAKTTIQTASGVNDWTYWYNTDGTVRMIIASENQRDTVGYMYSYKSISSPSVAAGLASRVLVSPDATIPYGSPFLKLN